MLFRGVVFHFYLRTIRWFTRVFEENQCESNLFRVIFELDEKLGYKKGVSCGKRVECR